MHTIFVLVKLQFPRSNQPKIAMVNFNRPSPVTRVPLKPCTFHATRVQYPSKGRSAHGWDEYVETDDSPPPFGVSFASRISVLSSSARAYLFCTKRVSCLHIIILIMKSSLQDDLLPIYSDEELLQLISCSQRGDRNNISRRVRFLSDKLIAVSSRTSITTDPQDTLKAMEVARHLGLQTPQVFRTVSAAPRNLSFIIMERVDGITLEQAWPNLSWITTVKLALQLRRFVSILRSQTSPTAGALASGKCNSFLLQDRFRLPVRSTPAAVWSFIEFWAGFTSTPGAIGAVQKGERISTKKGVPSMPSAFVMTHHGLTPRNMCVDKGNQLWIVNWEYAGWYPKFFEYAGMQHLEVPNNWNWLARLRWDVFSWITAGRYERERKLLMRIKYSSMSFGTSRRIEIVRYGAPSERPISPSESEEEES